MTVVFFIILFLILLTLVIVFSSIRIDIQKLNFSKQEKEKLNYDYDIIVELKFLGKIKVLKSIINPQKMRKLNKKVKIKQIIKNIDISKAKHNLPDKKQTKKIFNKMNIELKKFQLSLDIGTWDVIVTSAIVTILSSFLGIILAKFIDNYYEEKYRYKIVPIYENKNVIKLSLNCIIQVKVVHIISIIFTLVKKRKEKEKNERTSNRRSYDYSYE